MFSKGILKNASLQKKRKLTFVRHPIGNLFGGIETFLHNLFHI